MQQEEWVKELMGKAWDVLHPRDRAGDKPGIRWFIPALDAENGSGSVAGSLEMGTVGVFPKPSKYLCLRTKYYTVLHKNGLEKRDSADIPSGTSKRRGFKTSW